MLAAPSLCALIAQRSLPLLCSSPLPGTLLAAVPLTSVAVGTDCHLPLAPPARELPPGLRRLRTHRGSENRIRFLDSLVGICETPPWRCREIHAIAKEGPGVQDRAFDPISGNQATRNRDPWPSWRLAQAHTLAAPREVLARTTACEHPHESGWLTSPKRPSALAHFCRASPVTFSRALKQSGPIR